MVKNSLHFNLSQRNSTLSIRPRKIANWPKTIQVYQVSQGVDFKLTKPIQLDSILGILKMYLT